MGDSRVVQRKVFVDSASSTTTASFVHSASSSWRLYRFLHCPQEDNATERCPFAIHVQAHAREDSPQNWRYGLDQPKDLSLDLARVVSLAD